MHAAKVFSKVGKNIIRDRKWKSLRKGPKLEVQLLGGIWQNCLVQLKVEETIFTTWVIAVVISRI